MPRATVMDDDDLIAERGRHIDFVPDDDGDEAVPPGQTVRVEGIYSMGMARPRGRLLAARIWVSLRGVGCRYSSLRPAASKR